MFRKCVISDIINNFSETSNNLLLNDEGVFPKIYKSNNSYTQEKQSVKKVLDKIEKNENYPDPG